MNHYVSEINTMIAGDPSGDVRQMVDVVVSHHNCGTLEDLVAIEGDVLRDLHEVCAAVVDQLPGG